MSGTKPPSPPAVAAEAAEEEKRPWMPAVVQRLLSKWRKVIEERRRTADVAEPLSAEVIYQAYLMRKVIEGREPHSAEVIYQAHLMQKVIEERRRTADFDASVGPLKPDALTDDAERSVEAWNAADADSRLDALLARLDDTEARLDRQLARLGAESG